jgi:signal transduction histidine kinase
MLVNKLPLLDAAGEIENIVTVALDIGERKRGELEMRKAKDAAEAALRNLRETQNSLIEAEKLAALGRLVAGVAHEVNNPVGISLTVASSLERKTALFADEVGRGNLKRSSLNEFLETSRDAASQLVANLNRAAELIQSFKQVAADRNYSDQRIFDLGDLTEQVVMSLRPGLRKHHLTLSVDCQPNLTMNSYPGPYGQVLTNLFLNSVAHAFPDGKPGAVDIQVRESGKDNVEIIFSDNGCGMSLDVRRRAFDPFFTTRRDQGGTGLGLHIVYSIVTNRLGAAGSTSIPSPAEVRGSRSSFPGSRRWSRPRNSICILSRLAYSSSASLRSVALKIWLALPTRAVPSMTAAVSVKVPETPTPTGLGPPNSGLASGLLVWRCTRTSPLKVSPFDV